MRCKGTTFSWTAKTFSNFFIKILKKKEIISANPIKNCIFADCYYIIILMKQEKELVDVIIAGIQEKKGSQIVVADLNGIEGTICRYFVVCQGN